jgi:PRTRC genetic system ThiF family protein
VGGTGSWLAPALARIVYHARQKGQMTRLVLVDPDAVGQENIGRQNFSPGGEVGCNKAEAMAFRLNLALGLDITAVAASFTAGETMRWLYREEQRRHQTRFVLVGAVDNHLARRELAEGVSLGDGRVWAVDCGNARSNGQVLVGNLTDLSGLSIDKLGLCTGLPSPYVQEPDLLEPDPEDEAALSCAQLTQREEQSLLINAQVAAVAAQYVYDLIIRRTLGQYATYLDLEPPTMSSLIVTPTNLARLRQRLVPV